MHRYEGTTFIRTVVDSKKAPKRRCKVAHLALDAWFHEGVIRELRDRHGSLTHHVKKSDVTESERQTEKEREAERERQTEREGNRVKEGYVVTASSCS